MSIIQVTGSGGGISSDRTSFVGGRTPQDVADMVKLVKKMDKQTFRKLLQIAITALEDKPVTPDMFRVLESNSLTEEMLAVSYAGLHSMLKAALRLPQSSLKQEIFKEDLQELNIPAEFIPDLASVVFGPRRPRFEEVIMESRPRLPKLENFKWRVNVAISTSVLNRALEPSISMEMTVSDGKIRTFEVPVSKFHELRYNVAYVLKEMEDLEKRSILKIQD